MLEVGLTFPEPRGLRPPPLSSPTGSVTTSNAPAPPLDSDSTRSLIHWMTFCDCRPSAVAVPSAVPLPAAAPVPAPCGRLVGLLLGHREAARGLALRGLHLRVQQAVAHLPDHHEAQQQHDAQGHHQSGGDHPQLDVAPPQPHHGQQRTAHPPQEQPDDRAALDPALEQPAVEVGPQTRTRRPADSPPRPSPGPAGSRSGTVPGHVSSALPCNRHHGRSPRSPAAPGPSRPWSAAAGRAR